MVGLTYSVHCSWRLSIFYRRLYSVFDPSYFVGLLSTGLCLDADTSVRTQDSSALVWWVPIPDTSALVRRTDLLHGPKCLTYVYRSVSLYFGLSRLYHYFKRPYKKHRLYDYLSKNIIWYMGWKCNAIELRCYIGLCDLWCIYAITVIRRVSPLT